MPELSPSPSPHTPRDVLVHLQAFCEGQGFYYPRQTVANLYLSLRSKPFVILTGPSGTGKTLLLRLFAEGLGHADNCLLLPVRPEWQGRADLLGYRDLQGTFRRQPFLEWMLRAEAEPEQPFFIILDEMNLARVEYYLADVLSVMETRRQEGGRIQTQALLSGAELGEGSPADEALLHLGWPDNLYLAGTLNIDEAGLPLSRKVLDRANVIQMNEVRLEWPADAQPVPPLTEVYQDFLAASYVHARDISAEERTLLQPTLQWLVRLQRIMTAAGFPLGYRLRDELSFYLLHREGIRELISTGEALDLQLLQRVLPRLQGNHTSLGTLLPALIQFLAADLLPEKREPSYEAVRDAIGDPIKRQLPFPRSLRKLLAMYRQLHLEGLTTFWAS